MFTPEQVETLVAKGDLKDPILIAKLRADAAASANPLAPGAAPPVEIAPQIIKGPQPLAAGMSDAPTMPWEQPEAKAPGGFIVEAPPEAAAIAAPLPPTDSWGWKGGKPPAPVPAPKPVAAPPVQAPLNKPVMGKGPALGGGPAPAPKSAVDPAAFGLNEYDLALEKGQVKHLKNTQDLQGQAAQADAEQAESFEQIAQGVAAKYELEAQKQEQAAKRRQDFLTRYNAETTNQIEQYVNAKVDPNRYWHEKGTGGTLLAAIGIALGGYAQGLAAGAGKTIENGGLQMVEQGIARDIELQKAAIARKGAGIEARKGLYAQYLQQFGDEATAEQMAMETYLRKAKAEIDATAAKTTSKQVKINADALKGAIDFKIEQLVDGRKARSEHLYDDYQAKKQAAAQAANAAAAAELKKRNQMFVEANLKPLSEKVAKAGGVIVPAAQNIPLGNGAFIPAGMPVVYNAKGEIDLAGTEQATKIATVNMPVLQPGGSIGFNPTPVAAGSHGDVAKQTAGGTSAIQALQQMKKAAGMPGPWVGEKLKLYTQGQANYLIGYAGLKGQGQVTPKDKEMYLMAIPDVPTQGVGYLSDAQLAQLDNQIGVVAQETQNLGTVYGPPSAAGPAPLTSVGAPQ